MFRTAIIGCGVISAIHADALASVPGVELVAICDRDPEKMKGKPEHLERFTDYEALYESVKPDSVHICLPHDQHVPAARSALKHGIHVFLEKPLANEVEPAERLCEEARAAAKRGVLTGVCLQNRLNNCSQTLRERVLSGRDGAVRTVRSSVIWNRGKAYYDAEPWRGIMAQAGSGLLINQAIHTLDLMSYVTGSRPISVKGQIARLADFEVEVEDTASAIIDFEGGFRGTFFGTTAHYQNEPVEVEVNTEKTVYHIRGTQLFAKPAASPTDSGHWEELCEDLAREGRKFYYGAGHTLLIQAFYKRLAGDEEATLVTPDDALTSLKLVKGIMQSSEEKRRIVL